MNIFYLLITKKMVFYYQEKKIQKIKTWEEYIMAFSIEKETCIDCGACEGVCPVEAISQMS